MGSGGFKVENDNLCDDWCHFDTREEAEAWVRDMCRELAQANVDAAGIGNCPAFLGMPLEAIVERLYQENVDSIEEVP